MNRKTRMILLASCLAALAVLILVATQSKPITQSQPAQAESAQSTPSSERRFHIINLSLGRTGSKSIAGLFDRYRAAHEFRLLETLTHILDWREKRISDEELDTFLLDRDRNSRLEVDSTTVLHLAQDRILKLFPDAKFLLVVRDGDDWLVSTLDLMTFMYGKCDGRDAFYDLPCAEIIEQTSRLSRLITPHFKEMYYRDIENLATNMGPILPDIAAYWGKWTLKTLENLSQLPPDQVFITRTRNIDYSLDGLASFAGIAKSDLVLSNHHLNRDRKTYDFASMIGPDKINAAFQPWQSKVDARLEELGIE